MQIISVMRELILLTDLLYLRVKKRAKLTQRIKRLINSHGE